ncbi:MAG TPA: hypothetical protein VF060_19790 [Trebonia sp.]
MSWIIGQIHASAEGIPMDLADLRAGLPHLETFTHAHVTALRTTLDERVRATGQARHHRSIPLSRPGPSPDHDQ